MTKAKKIKVLQRPAMTVVPSDEGETNQGFAGNKADDNYKRQELSYHRAESTWLHAIEHICTLQTRSITRSTHVHTCACTCGIEYMVPRAQCQKPSLRLRVLTLALLALRVHRAPSSTDALAVRVEELLRPRAPLSRASQMLP